MHKGIAGGWALWQGQLSSSASPARLVCTQFSQGTHAALPSPFLSARDSIISEHVLRVDLTDEQWIAVAAPG